MVLRRIKAEGMERSLLRLQNMVGLDAQLADHVDLDALFRLSARLDGVPEEVLRSEHRVFHIRRSREEQATAAAMAAAGEQLPAEEPSGDAGPPLAELLPGYAPADAASAQESAPPPARKARRERRPRYQQADLPFV
jgi:hypothetical protein